MDIGRLIRAARARTGLTQTAFAVRAGTSQSALSAYESGRRVPTLAVLQRFMEVADGHLHLEFSPPTRARSTPPPDRGKELERVLELAAQFPARHAPTLDYPRFAEP